MSQSKVFINEKGGIFQKLIRALNKIKRDFHTLS